MKWLHVKRIRFDCGNMKEFSFVEGFLFKIEHKTVSKMTRNTVMCVMHALAVICQLLLLYYPPLLG